MLFYYSVLLILLFCVCYLANNNCLFLGLQKASIFLKTRIVPDNWKMDISEILESSSSDDEDGPAEENDEEKEKEAKKEEEEVVGEILCLWHKVILIL